MKRTYFAYLFLFLTTTFLWSQSNPVPQSNRTTPRVVSPVSGSQTDPKAQARILDNYGKLPLSFEANHGQTDSRVKFLSRTRGYTLFLTGDEAVLALSGTRINGAKTADAADSLHPGMASTKAGGVLRMKLRNSNPAAKVTGVAELVGKSNYFIGNDPAKWRTNVPSYAKVKYEGIYSGIDLVYYGNQRQLEYDFIVAPGADPHRIQFDVRGATRIRRDQHGDLVLKMSESEIYWQKPVVYQEKDGAKQEIAARYDVKGANRVGFQLAKYDASRPLYIDPLIYSTYLGGTGSDGGAGIAVDSLGNAYVTGYTGSTNFPITPGALQTTCCGGDYNIAFVVKLNPTGSALVYSTYLGGTGPDAGFGIAVDSSGDAYVTGMAESAADFPTTPNAFQTTFNGVENAFVCQLNPSGSALVYSTYLGGSGADYGNGIAVDSSGNAYVTGRANSTNFPVTPGAFQTTLGGYDDAFVTKINPSGSALVYSTYLGGSGYEDGRGITVDSSGNAYVTGATGSTNFPTMNPLQPANAGGEYDGFVTQLNPSGSALVYSTYLGGSGSDASDGIAVDSSGNAYVTGDTASVDFPITPNALQTVCNGGSGCTSYGDAFVTKLNPTGSALVYSTYLGGTGPDAGFGIAVDSSGDAYVTGSTSSTNFPTVNPLQAINNNSANGTAFVTQLNPSGSALVYSTYLGGSEGTGGTSQDRGSGIAVDSSGNAYVTGFTSSNNFPTMNPLQPANAGGFDAFVAKISTALSSTTTIASASNPSAFGQSVTFTAKVTSQASGTPTGTVTFTYGSTTLCNALTLSGGTATCAYSTLPVGSDIVTATYSGDSNFGGSTASLNQTVNKPTSTTTVTSLLSPSSFNQQVTFTATVTVQFGGTPTGTVTFTYGSTTLCNALTLSGGTATCAYSTLPVGSDIVTATYSGDSNFGGSTASLNQTVNQASTTTTLTSNVNPSRLGSPVTFTATITPQYGGQATGTVTFYNDSTTLGSGAVSSNAASLTTSGLAMGTHSITAIYGGDSNFTGSTSNTLSQVVTKATTTTTLLSSINPSVQGKSVTFTANVSSLAGTPTGKVQFLNGTTVLATLMLTSGSAKYTMSKLPPGANSITAVYEGDTNNSGSTSAPVNQFVIATTTTTVTSSPNPSTYGQSVIVTATVTSSIGAPPDGETVTFKQGSTVLGTGTLSGGTASFSDSTLAVGTKSIEAVYGGDANFASSTSKAVRQVIARATSTTTLVSSQNPSSYEQSVTFTATVAPEFSGTPTGTVTFKNGTTTLGTETLSGGTASYTTSKLTTGTHNITTTYNGSTSFTASAAALMQTVQ